MDRFFLPQTPPGVRLHRVEYRFSGFDVCECGAVRATGKRCDVGAAQARASKSARRARRTARRQLAAAALGTYSI